MPAGIRPRYKRAFALIDQPPGEIILVPVDGAIPIAQDRHYLVTKGSAAALTIAAPGAANIGRVIRVIAGSNFAHVLTFTGGTLRGGTAATATATTAAFAGASITLIGLTATTWGVLANNACTLA